MARPQLLFFAPLVLLSCRPGEPVGSKPDTGVHGDTAPPEDSGTAPDEDPCDPEGDDVDTSLLDDAVAWIAANPNHIDSFQVHHCGQVLVERYYNGYDVATLHELQSATKTFSAVLVGIAIDQGLIEGVEQPIAELLPDYDCRLLGAKAQITVGHLLTMTSGLSWTDFGPDNSFDRIAAAEDSVAFIIGEALVSMPGEVFAYNTGSSHLLSAIIHYNAGMDTAEYAERYLFGPLGIEDYLWPALRDGVNQGGWGMYMRPADFAKLGQLLLDEGSWQAQAVLSQDYVDAATAPQVSTDDGGWYGYQMWVETNLFTVDDIAAARGYGGQDCFVLEDLDMVVTFTGDINFPGEMALDVKNLMNQYILPAHRGR